MKVLLYAGSSWKPSTTSIVHTVEITTSGVGAWTLNLRADRRCFILPSKSIDCTRTVLKLPQFIHLCRQPPITGKDLLFAKTGIKVFLDTVQGRTEGAFCFFCLILQTSFFASFIIFRSFWYYLLNHKINYACSKIHISGNPHHSPLRLRSRRQKTSHRCP